jgi:CRP-like cAMP-binding protein
MAGSPASVCYPLQEDSELAEAIDPGQRAAAIGALAARELEVPPGVWAGDPLSIDGGMGLLVLEGILIRRIGIGGRFSAELLGEGDILRNVNEEALSPLPMSSGWLILESARLAVLDERFVRQLAGFPRLAGRLFGRSVLRSRQIAVNMAIVHQARVDVRLHMLLWHLAGRWGRVRSDGVLVPLRLTHAILADLVAARRPTVTSALTELGREGLVQSIQEGWLLSGEPPGELERDATPAG